MIFHAFLIKYAEIAIKGKNRYIFEDALVKQMNIALSKVEGEFEVKKEQGRIYVFCVRISERHLAVAAVWNPWCARGWRTLRWSSPLRFRRSSRWQRT